MTNYQSGLHDRTVQTYYWIVSRRLGDGRLTIIGPRTSQSEAEQFAYEHNLEPFEVVPLHTRNRASATSSLKARNLDRTGNLEQSVQRASHQSSGNSGITEDNDGGW